MPSRTKSRPARRPSRNGHRRIRWAVAGQGYFAQAAVLPAFAHARKNSELVAIFSSDQEKRSTLRKRHDVEFALPYEEMDDFLRSGQIDALYVAVPNHRHKEFTLRAAHAGVHVLCEKPMAVTSRECRDMIAACEESRVKLMIAYRLHLEKANMTAVEKIRRGSIGDPRYFSSIFSFQVDDDNVRNLPTDQGGGPLYDIGVYCINAARYLFRAEPSEVVSLAACRADDSRFKDTDEQIGAVLRFPEERLASFVVGFGAHDVASFTVVGTGGSLQLDPAYSHSTDITLREQTTRGHHERVFRKTDQVAPELTYFADCILSGREPEPSGWEGLHDVRIVEAILEAARTGRKVQVDLEERPRPSRAQVREAKPHPGKPPLVHAEPPRSR